MDCFDSRRISKWDAIDGVAVDCGTVGEAIDCGTVGETSDDEGMQGVIKGAGIDGGTECITIDELP